MLPLGGAWDRPILDAPVDPRSASYISSIGGAAGLHADFGPTYGIPFQLVPADQPLRPVRFTLYGEESDPGPYPLPDNAKIEAGGDRHVLVLQQKRCRLYELFGARFLGAAGWEADCGAVFDLLTNKQRPAGWTSADAAGLPILPGLVRYEEVAAGQIQHALRFTAPRTQRAYVEPARHQAGSTTDGNYPPMGLRVRLKRSFDLTPYKGPALVILQALQRYGMLLADNGGAWFISGAPDPRWREEDLNQLKRVPGSALEAVKTGTLVY